MRLPCNQTAGTNRIFDETRSFTATYQNNRRDGFQYDAAGNLTNDGLNTFGHDAAGNNETAAGIRNVFNGDGQTVKRTFPQNGSSIWYVSSTVLGGRVVAEINGGFSQQIPTGGKLRGHIYAGVSQIAIQDVTQNTDYKVIWQHEDPVTGSVGITYKDGGYLRYSEPDPLGGNLTPPAPPPPGIPPLGSGGSDSTIIAFSDFMGETMCNVDGLDVRCSTVSGAFVILAPTVTVKSVYNPRTEQWELERWQQTADGFAGFLPVNSKYHGNGEWSWGGKSGKVTLRMPGQRRSHEGGGYGKDGEADGVIGRSTSPRGQTQSIHEFPGQQDLPSLISATRDIIKDAKGPCADLLGKDALKKFDEISGNIKFTGKYLVDVKGPDGRLRQDTWDNVPLVFGARDGDQIHLNPGSYGFARLYGKPSGQMLAVFKLLGAADQREMALGTIIHEFLHMTGRFKADSVIELTPEGPKINNADSIKHSKEVIKKCFPKK
ncbi:MAG: hypothetical protein ACREA2_09945 [Blastocatellia bacterium]